jgi:hypothetical protein
MKGGAKRLKALLKATMIIVRFVFQNSTRRVIDHRLITHLPSRFRCRRSKVFGAYTPAFRNACSNSEVELFDGHNHTTNTPVGKAASLSARL